MRWRSALRGRATRPTGRRRNGLVQRALRIHRHQVCLRLLALGAASADEGSETRQGRAPAGMHSVLRRTRDRAASSGGSHSRIRMRPDSPPRGRPDMQSAQGRRAMVLRGWAGAASTRRTSHRKVTERREVCNEEESGAALHTNRLQSMIQVDYKSINSSSLFAERELRGRPDDERMKLTSTP